MCIATPDHWHAIPMLAALRAGKDVYCEKPLTHNIHEAVEILKAVDANQRVLQTGSMAALDEGIPGGLRTVRDGLSGRSKRLRAVSCDPGRPCDVKEESPEPGLDWDFGAARHRCGATVPS